MSENLKAPFPYFGKKNDVAAEVWNRLGRPSTYIEPFFGSGAVLLGRPDFNPSHPPHEIINDKDGMVANFWRAVKFAPEDVAYYADWPINENDLYARHNWLIENKPSIVANLDGPDWFDPKAAGWWAWGMSQWIGGGFCDKITRKMPKVCGPSGIHNNLTLAGADIKGMAGKSRDLESIMLGLQERLRFVYVLCGDWSRAVSSEYLVREAAIFLDPPYSSKDCNQQLYAETSNTVAKDVEAWAIAHQHLKIALCGYDGEHDMSEWTVHQWTASGGLNSLRKGEKSDNRFKERIWFSPSCKVPKVNKLF